jgi:hypothetical protein
MFCTSVKIPLLDRSRIFGLALKWIVLDSAAIDEHTAVGQHDHGIAKHVPGERLRCYRAGLRVPEGGAVIGLSRNVAGTGDDEYFPVVSTTPCEPG